RGRSGSLFSSATRPPAGGLGRSPASGRQQLRRESSPRARMPVRWRGRGAESPALRTARSAALSGPRHSRSGLLVPVAGERQRDVVAAARAEGCFDEVAGGGFQVI